MSAGTGRECDDCHRRGIDLVWTAADGKWLCWDCRENQPIMLLTKGARTRPRTEP